MATAKSVTRQTPAGFRNFRRRRKRKLRRHFSKSETKTDDGVERTSMYLGDNFAVTYSQWFKLKRLVGDTENCGIIHTTFRTLKKMGCMSLSPNAQKLVSVPNAGGSSVISEVLSFELLHRCFGAHLLKTEMEVSYFPFGGSITDYVCEMGGVKMGVSVTRAMKFHGDFTVEEGRRLLDKKLTGIVQSTRNSLEKWSKQILHVWTKSAAVSNLVTRAFDLLNEETKSNTIVLVTVASNCDAIFTNK